MLRGLDVESRFYLRAIDPIELCVSFCLSAFFLWKNTPIQVVLIVPIVQPDDLISSDLSHARSNLTEPWRNRGTTKVHFHRLLTI